eukprot:Nitzschia sp. Nitz4//scaffold96_size78090//38956//39588//NITZ4_005495-RA/size78090-augustus-gene-0.4-mRNA-1//1//CDS//3329560576//2905//frame0
MGWNLAKTRRASSSPSSTDSSSPARRSFFGSRNKRRALQKGCSEVSETSDTITSDCTTRTESAAWRVDNIRPSAPTQAEWWTETCGSNDGQDCSDEDGYETMDMNPSYSTAKFHNCGLQTWLQARKEWNKQTVETLPPKPSPGELSKLARGLKKHIGERKYELPRRMALSDLIDVYTVIWDDAL